MNEVRYLGARRIRELLDRYDVRLKKRLGQNFVIDPNTIRKVVDIARLDPDHHVLEIGAGAGSLTVALAGAVRRVTAIEIDERMQPILEEVLRGVANVDLHFEDVKDLDLGSFGATNVVANLPYNVAAGTVLQVLEQAPEVAEAAVLTQREVGERLAAAPGTGAYGLTSVLLAFHGEAEVAGSVSRNAFFPVPRVDSVIVSVHRRAVPDVDAGSFYAIAKAAFGQRRKTLRQALASLAGSPAEAETALLAAGIDPSRRAEEIDLAGFVRVAEKWAP
jgi:16S rRNA (adenine1518-N6/adenine1519-N6)-dimethyltransferase